MKAWLKILPRPCGAEPRIYIEKPVNIPEEVEVEPGYFLVDPYTDPHIMEFESELAARRYMKETYPMCYHELLKRV